jgi:hypothetical protein
LPKAELRSERIRETADPRLPHISHLEIPRESVKRPRATQPAFVSDPAHGFEGVRDEGVKYRREGRQWATKWAFADVVLERPCALGQQSARDGGSMRPEVVDKPRQGPPHGGHQIGVVREIGEFAGQRRPPTNWNLTSCPGAPVDATAGRRAVLHARDERASPACQERLETADDWTGDQPRRHLAGRSWNKRPASKRWGDCEPDAGEDLTEGAPFKPRGYEDARGDSSTGRCKKWNRADPS